MSKIVATMKIFPKNIIKDFSNVKKSITKMLPKEASVYKFEEEPIAFGLITLIAHVVLPESTNGALEKIEHAIKNLEDVSEVEVVLTRRI